jgi:hypothetical protein
MATGLKQRSTSLGADFLISTPELLVVAAADGAADRFGSGWFVHAESERGELSLVRRDGQSSYWFSFQLLSLETLAKGVTQIREDIKRLAKSGEPNAHAVGLVYATTSAGSLVKTLKTRESLEVTAGLAKSSVGTESLSSDVLELTGTNARCWVQLIAWCATSIVEPRVSVPAP